MTNEENSSAATTATLNHHHHHSLYDDDGHPKRTGTVWTTSSHVIKAVIGSGVLSLAWSIGRLGWIGGPLVMLFFGVVTLYTSYFLADSYRVGDPINGKRSYTYMEAIDNILGNNKTNLHMVA
ncbi:Amino acid permease 4 [Stylosanthes scabra]|uniref:Amino acid permease 4 n=1 Tax=Stylosanthes scabra TaxID=79078 RepID=A0ABU6X711_9FABA|nr:Amino acid permease 4 [Stylosanthes scabra]